MEQLVKQDIDVAGEMQALVDALGQRGRGLGWPESGMLTSSRCGLRELRRVPPTDVTPLAEDPPVLRALYGFVDRGHDGAAAVLLLGGDKTSLKNEWYPPNIAEAERLLVILAGQRGWRVMDSR
jgi:hypothetical protein